MLHLTYANTVALFPAGYVPVNTSALFHIAYTPAPLDVFYMRGHRSWLRATVLA